MRTLKLKTFKLLNSFFVPRSVMPARKRHLTPLPIHTPTFFMPTLMEKGFLMKSLFFHGTTQVFCLLQLHGPRLSREHLEDALRILQMRHPFLRCRPRLKEGTLLFEHDWKIRLPIFESDQSWEETWNRIQKSTFPLWEASVQIWQIWEETDQRNDLILSLSHAICDGISAHSLLQELLQILNHPSTSHSLSEADLLKQACVHLPRSSSSFTLASLSLRLIFSSIGALLETLWHASPLFSLQIKTHDDFHSPQDLAQKNRTLTQTLEIEPHTLHDLKKNCAHFHTTLTAALTSAYASTLSSLPSQNLKSSQHGVFQKLRIRPRVKILWPVQLRPLYSEKAGTHELAMHTSFLTFSIPTHTFSRGATDLWRIAHTLGQKARKRRKRKIPLIFSYFAARATASPLSKSRSGHSAFFSLSNIGSIEAPPLTGQWSLKHFLILCQLASCKHPSLILFTQNQKLIITLLASSPSIDKTWLDSLQKSFKKKIEGMATPALFPDASQNITSALRQKSGPSESLTLT